MKPVGDRYIPVDPALPALAELFPGETSQRLAASAIAELTGDASFADLDISYVRYRPGKSCVVLWTRREPDDREIIGSGRVSHNDRGRKLLDRASIQPLLVHAAEVTRRDPAYRYFDDERLLIQRYPLDLRLPEVTMNNVPQWLQTNIVGANNASVATTVVSYKPWRRCVMRYDVASNGSKASYYGKVFRDDQGASLLRWHEAIRKQMAASCAPWTVPAAVDYVGHANTLLFHALDGASEVRRMLRPARKNAEAKQRLLDHMAAAATGLGAFQKTHLDGLRSETPAELIASFQRSGSGIAAVAPEFAASVDHALSLLQDTAERLHPEPIVPAHGAFRHDQLLEHEGRLVVLDLDTICMSGASADAGNFLGYLDLTAIRRPRLESVIGDCAGAFVVALRDAGFSNNQWIAWYRAAAHVKKALRAFFSLEPGWPETSQRLLALANETLREGVAP